MPPFVAEEGCSATRIPEEGSSQSQPTGPHSSSVTRRIHDQSPDKLLQPQGSSSLSPAPQHRNRFSFAGTHLSPIPTPSVLSHPITTLARPQETLAVPPDARFENHSTQRQNVLSPVAPSLLLRIEQIY